MANKRNRARDVFQDANGIWWGYTSDEDGNLSDPQRVAPRSGGDDGDQYWVVMSGSEIDEAGGPSSYTAPSATPAALPPAPAPTPAPAPAPAPASSNGATQYGPEVFANIVTSPKRRSGDDAESSPAPPKLYRSAHQDASGNWWAFPTDEDGGPTGEPPVRVKAIRGEDENGIETLKFQAMPHDEIVRADKGGVFSSEDIAKLATGEDYSFKPGDTIPYDAWLSNIWANDPASYGGNAKDVAPLFGGQAPTPDQFLASQYTPWRKNADGTVTNDANKATSSIYYNGDTSLMEQLMPALILGVGAAGLGGLLPGTTSIFGGAAPAAAAGGELAGGGLGSIASDFSLMAPGTGLPTVGSTAAGSAGLGLNTAGLGLTPELIAAGGGAGAMGVGSGLGLSLGTGGLIADTAAGLAAQAGVTLPNLPTLTADGLAPYTAPTVPNTPTTMPEPTPAPTQPPATMPEPTPAPMMPEPTPAPGGLTQPPAPVQNLTTPGLLPGTTNVASGIMNTASIWDQLGQALGLSTTAMDGLKGIAGFGGSVLEYLQSKDNGKDIAAAIDRASATADPFGSQRGYYQDLLKQSYTDPNFFKNNATFKGLNDIAVSDAQRAAAARGYNNSSNVLYDVADRVQKTGMNFANQLQGQLAQNAGAGISPGTAATIQAQGAQTVANANQQTNGALGATLGQLPNLINGIKGLI